MYLKPVLDLCINHLGVVEPVYLARLLVEPFLHFMALPFILLALEEHILNQIDFRNFFEILLFLWLVFKKPSEATLSYDNLLCNNARDVDDVGSKKLLVPEAVKIF